MKGFGFFIAQNRILVIVIALFLLAPSLFFMNKTKINYDIMSYLPNHLQSMKGQEILDHVFSNGTSLYVILENMDTPDIVSFKEKISSVSGVRSVLWIDDMIDPSTPPEILPEDIRKIFFNQNSTLMIVTTDAIDTEEVAKVTKELRREIKGNPNAENIYLSGMPVLLKDSSDLVLDETNKCVIAAGVLAIILMFITLESTYVPFLMFITMGFTIVFNTGSNVILGEISYITKSLVIVLQLGVTMDYSIFLYHRYMEEKKKRLDRNAAMANAISKTFISIAGSSLTTIAGFLSLCAMKLGFGWDMGLVMTKGVVIGVFTTITVLPALLLTFDSLIERSKHRVMFTSFQALTDFTIKHHNYFLIIMILLIAPSVYGEKNAELYYNLDESLPKDMESVIALNKLKDDYKMTTIHMVITSPELPAFAASQMADELKNVDGIENVISYDSFIGPGVPESFVPKAIIETFKSKGYGLILLNTEYKTGSGIGDNQLDIITEIVNKTDPKSIVAGEGALGKDLVRTAAKDFRNVNILSILTIFIIVGLLFKSFIIPLLLVSIIELAIMINMAIPYYTNTTIPFIASIVIGCIQLGSTVDYAILLTGRFKEEMERINDKRLAMKNALQSSVHSIVTSSLIFFGATAVVGLISTMDMIKALCEIISRGVLISMVVIIFFLPSLLLLLEGFIAATTINWRVKRRKLLYGKK